MKNPVIITVIAALLFGTGGFFGGMQYQKSQRTSGSFGNRQFSANSNLQGRTGQNGQRMGTGRVMGEILSIDDESFTVKLPDSSSKIVLLSENTSYSKSSEGNREDLKVGDQVGIFGTTNSDGSVSANDIQINPSFRPNISNIPQQ